MRTSYKHATQSVCVPDNVLQQAPPIFFKVVKNQVELVICERFLPKEYLPVAGIQNFAQKMLTGTELRKDLLWKKDHTDREK
jgi:hypothetical protein